LEAVLAGSSLTRDEVLDVCRSAEDASPLGAQLLAFTRDFVARRGDELARIGKVDETILRCTPLAAELTALYPDPDRKAELHQRFAAGEDFASVEAPLKQLIGRGIDDYCAVVLEALATYADHERASRLGAAAISARTSPR
jgi:hypothetical protein